MPGLARVAPLIADGSGIAGALVLNECHLHSSERMTLAFVKTAVAHGAVAANYVAADGLLREGRRVVGVRARDVERDDELRIRARVTVNAVGSVASGPERPVRGGPAAPAGDRLGQGAHIVTRQVMGLCRGAPDRAGVRVAGRARRPPRLVIPWRGHSLIGTSNRPFRGDPDTVAPTEQDVADLVGDVNRALPSAALAAGDGATRSPACTR